MSSWLPSNVQTRLVKYILTQIGLFDELALVSADLQLGSSSSIDIEQSTLNLDRVKIPGFNVRSGNVASIHVDIPSNIFFKPIHIILKGVQLSLSPSYADSSIPHNVDEVINDASEYLATSLILDNDTEMIQAMSQLDSDTLHIPGAFRNVPDTDTDTDNNSIGISLTPMFSSIIETLLRQLKISVFEVSGNILIDDDNLSFELASLFFKADSTVKDGHHLELSGLRLNDITQRSESNEDSDSESDSSEDIYLDKSLLTSTIFSKAEASSLYQSAFQDIPSARRVDPLLHSTVDTPADTPADSTSSGFQILSVSHLSVIFDKQFTYCDLNLGKVELSCPPESQPLLLSLLLLFNKFQTLPPSEKAESESDIPLEEQSDSSTRTYKVTAELLKVSLGLNLPNSQWFEVSLSDIRIDSLVDETGMTAINGEIDRISVASSKKEVLNFKRHTNSSPDIMILSEKDCCRIRIPHSISVLIDLELINLFLEIFSIFSDTISELFIDSATSSISSTEDTADLQRLPKFVFELEQEILVSLVLLNSERISLQLFSRTCFQNGEIFIPGIKLNYADCQVKLTKGVCQFASGLHSALSAGLSYSKAFRANTGLHFESCIGNATQESIARLQVLIGDLMENILPKFPPGSSPATQNIRFAPMDPAMSASHEELICKLLVKIGYIHFTAGIPILSSLIIEGSQLCFVLPHNSDIKFSFGMSIKCISRSSDKFELDQFGEKSLLYPTPMLTSTAPSLSVNLMDNGSCAVTISNIVLEYYADILLLFSDMSSDQKPMSTSTNLAPTSTPAPEPAQSPISVKIWLNDSVIGLNPFGTHSKALLFLNECSAVSSQFQSEIRNRIHMQKAHLLLIDDVNFFVSKTTSSADISDARSLFLYYLQGGFVSIASFTDVATTAKLFLNSHPPLLDVDVGNELIFLESCADSTATLLELVQALRPPVLYNPQRYRTSGHEVDTFDGVADRFFPHSASEEEVNDNHMSQENHPIRIADEVIENYYGYSHDSTIAATSMDSSQQPDTLLDVEFSEVISQGKSSASIRNEIPSAKDSKGSKRRVNFAPEHASDFIHSVYFEGEPQFNETHFARIGSDSRKAPLPGNNVNDVIRVNIHDLNLVWNLHDGYDWKATRRSIEKAVREAHMRKMRRRRSREYKQHSNSEIGSTTDSGVDDIDSVADGQPLFNSIYISFPADHDASEINKKLTRDITGYNYDNVSRLSSQSVGTSFNSGVQRDTTTSPLIKQSKLNLKRSRVHKVKIELRGVNVNGSIFEKPDKDMAVCKFELKVRDFEVYDNVATSTWLKLVTYMRSAGPRDPQQPMMSIHVSIVQPDLDLSAFDLMIKANILPLRLHVDQDTLEFLARFFQFQPDRMNELEEQSEEPFFQKVQVSDISIKLDYKPKKVDYAGLRSRHTTELMNFFVLDEAEILLRPVKLYGIKGIPQVIRTLNRIWLPDIQRTQLGAVLAGVSPIRAVVRLGSGFKELITVPMEEYKKDGRLFRSAERGARQFVRTSANELMKFGAKLAVGTHNWLESAEEVLGGEYAGSSRDRMSAENEVSGSKRNLVNIDGEVEAVSAYADQPKTISQGLSRAYQRFGESLRTTGEVVGSVPEDATEKGTAVGFVHTLARAAPVVLLRPAIGTTEAVSNTLMGLANQLDPETQKYNEDKYKPRGRY
ncbi:hypothetical protein CANCADRAFT_30264 [Tortispora caseinolytica NRRL Y-17796]|uniref:Autophagy-related protein 2 n=1 Tax=Tortispora caseinolytica NRRL Y-17796 TaxID=767744 RepID=A0A1E4TJS1_9ASCO|nr:hypothetical protein CANCADRAFT_30264 [Tortispora caseinolytica NRRL Y-17796]